MLCGAVERALTALFGELWRSMAACGPTLRSLALFGAPWRSLAGLHRALFAGLHRALWRSLVVLSCRALFFIDAL